MFSLLATTHDLENRFQKLNEMHRRRLSNWNRHTDSLTCVARSHHCHQALAMINNATNVSLVDWIILWTLTIQFCWSKHWGYSFSCEMVIEWQIYVRPDCIFCHSDGCKKVAFGRTWIMAEIKNVMTVFEVRSAIECGIQCKWDSTCVAWQVERKESTINCLLLSSYE